jgi:hypothetical protein
MSARQSFVLLLPLVVQRLRHAIQDADNETALKAILVYWKMQGDRPVTEGISTVNELADLSTSQLVERALIAITALQAPTGPAPDSTGAAQDAPGETIAAPDALTPRPDPERLETAQSTPGPEV